MTDIVTIGLSVDSSQVDKGTDSLNKMGKQSGETATSTDKLNQSWQSMATQVAGAAAVLATTIAVVKASIQAADEYNRSLTGLASVARYAGQDVGGTLNTALQLTKDGVLSTTEAATALKNLLAKGFSTDEAVQMINRLKDSAAFGRQSTLDWGDAIVGATEGIKNENSMMIDNAGVTKNAAVMVDEYAKSIGKKTNALSEAEKRTALYNGILRETEGQVGNAKLATQGLSGQQAMLSKNLNDVAVTIGQALMPAVTSLVGFLATGMGALNENIIKPFIFLFKNIGITIGEVVMKAGALFDLLASPIEFMKNPTESLQKFQATTKLYGDIAEAERLRVATELNTMAVPDIGKDTGSRRADIVATVDTTKEDNKAKREAERLAEKERREIEALNRSVERIQQAHMSETELLSEKYAQEQLVIDEALLAKQLSEEEHMRLMMTLQADYATKSVKIAEEMAKQKKYITSNEVQFTLNITNELSKLMASKNKVLFQVGKAAAIANATIGMYEGANKALAQGGFFGIAMAAAVVATGLVNIANIKSQSFGGGGGGSIGGSSGGVFNPGELMAQPLNPTQPTAQAAPVQARELRVTIDSDGPHSEGMRAFARNLAETIKDMGGTDNLVIS